MKSKPTGPKYRNLIVRGSIIYFQRRVGQRRVRFSCKTDDWQLAAEIAQSAPVAVRGVKRALNRTMGASLEDQLSFEAHEQAGCFETRDVHEGLAAVKDARAPKFEGQ